jgi:hypothetical protein
MVWFGWAVWRALPSCREWSDRRRFRSLENMCDE